MKVLVTCGYQFFSEAVAFLKNLTREKKKLELFGIIDDFISK